MTTEALGTMPPSPAAPANPQELLTQQVQGLIDEACVGLEKNDERRTRNRVPIPYTFRLIPVSPEGALLTDEITTIVGKDLSLTGIGFSHDHEIKAKLVVISLDHPKVGRFAVEAEIVWTRPTPIGLYESGCRLVRTIGGHTVRAKG